MFTLLFCLKEKKKASSFSPLTFLIVLMLCSQLVNKISPILKVSNFHFIEKPSHLFRKIVLIFLKQI